jgi:hypothetical protein
MRNSTCLVALTGLALAASAVLFETQPLRASPPTETPVKIVHAEIASMPLRAYAYAATDVVYGTVAEIGPAYHELLGDYTAMQVNVISSLKLQLPSSIQVALAACDTCSPRVIVPGSPTFQVGEQVALFVQGDPSVPAYGILGLDQGTYRVQTDGSGATHVYGLYASGEDVATFLSTVNQAWADGL